MEGEEQQPRIAEGVDDLDAFTDKNDTHIKKYRKAERHKCTETVTKTDTQYS